MKRLIALAAIATLASMLVPTSSLAAKGNSPAAATDHAYYDRVFTRMEAVRQAGGSKTDVNAMLAKEFGWIKVAGGDAAITAAASASDVTFYQPEVYRNTQQGRYEASADWQWKMCGSIKCWGANYPCITGNVGGPDGFGISSSVKVYYKSAEFATYDERGTLHHYTVPDAFDDDGTGFTEQDTMHCNPLAAYTWDHGFVIFGFNLKTCTGMRGTPWIFKSKMGHTWTSTSVSSISISPNSVNITFSSTENRWTGVSPNPLYWYPCGV